MENTEPMEVIGECRFCLSNSISFLCDDCKSVIRKNGLVEIKNEGDYEWYRWNVNPFTQKKISKQICDDAGQK